jgi:hypothetical protein
VIDPESLAKSMARIGEAIPGKLCLAKIVHKAISDMPVNGLEGL